MPPDRYETGAPGATRPRPTKAALIQLQIEDLRRIAGRPCGGFCHFSFADAQAAVTWSVLDHLRTPKAGYGALRDACRTVLPMLDPRTGALHVSNTGRRRLTGATLEVADGSGRVRRFTGDVPPSDVVYVGRIDPPAASDGRLADVRLTLEHPDTGTVVNGYGRVLTWTGAASKSGGAGAPR